MGYATLDQFRGRQSGGRSRFPFLLVLSGVMVLMGLIIGAAELVAYSDEYRTVSETFGNDVTIGGVQVGGLDESERLAALEVVYIEQPITLSYGGNEFLMSPQEVGLRLNTEAMQAAANAQLVDDFWGGFWKFLWREERNAINIPVYADYDPADIRAYLQTVARRYDSASSGTGFDVGTSTFTTASASTALNIDGAIPLIERALFAADANGRRVELPTSTTPGSAISIDALEAAIIQYLDAEPEISSWNGPDSLVSVFILDLQTGEEVAINEYVTHDGLSTVKVGVLVNFFRYQLAEPDALQKYQLLNAVACSDNGSANQLIDATSTAASGFGQGFLRLVDTFCQSGAVYTFMRSHLNIGEAGTGLIPENYYTPIVAGDTCENQSTIPADLDSTGTKAGVVTTAADMGTLLMNLYDCAEYGSGLATIFEGEVTQNECRQTVELLRSTHAINMSELGVPEGTDIAHKVGYFGDTSGDVGIVYTPGGDFVFAFYLWERDSDLSIQRFKWEIFGNLTRIAYNYFNPNAPMMQTRQPPQDGFVSYCVVPREGFEVNLNDINENRFTPEGIPDPVGGCYAPTEGCIDFDNWGITE